MIFQQIECFLSVAHNLSFSRAAEDLYMAQSSVTQQIKSLEDDVGFMLFDRNKRSVRLTAAGAFLQGEFLRMMEAMRQSVYKARQIASGSDYALQIAYPNPPQWGRMPELIAGFHAKEPGVAIGLKLDKGRELLALFATGVIDVLFGDMEYLKQIKNVNCLPLFRTETYVLIPENHPLSGRKRVTIDEANHYKVFCVNPESADSAIVTLSNRLEKVGLRTKSIIPVAHREDVVASVYAGIGLGIVPGSVISDYYATQTALLDATQSCFEFGCAWRTESTNEKLTVFINMAREFGWIGEKIVV